MTMVAKRIKPTAQEVRELEASARPFRTHYAGMRIGACSTVENAAEAVFRHVLRGHCTNGQVVTPAGHDAFRFDWTSYGIAVTVPRTSEYKRPKDAPKPPAGKPPLRVIK